MEEFRRNNDEADVVVAVVVVTGCLDGVDVDATCLLLLVSIATFISGSSLMLPPPPFDVDADNNCISCMRICFLNEDGCV